MNACLYMALAAVAAAGLLGSALAQTSDNVVINEVDINPPGNDAESISEWVELYNPTDSPIDLRGWEVASTITNKVLVLQPGTVLGPGDLAVFSHQRLWFGDAGESVELRTRDGVLVDKTPSLTDAKNDFSSWQRLYDGYAPNSISDWKFVLSSPGSSNGRLVEQKAVVPVSVAFSIDKESYLFGETAIVRGNVSEIIHTANLSFRPVPVEIKITGPGFERNVSLIPDSNLRFETSLDLRPVEGIEMGVYTVSVAYSSASATANFAVGDRIIAPNVEEDLLVTVTTDKPSYMPGDTVTITATANKEISLEGMRFEVTDPDGNLAGNGHIFPKDGVFTTGIFLTPINPKLGTYEIMVTYGDVPATVTFEVAELIRGNYGLSLVANSTAYGVGDTVKITGTLSRSWSGPLDLSVKQPKVIGANTIAPFTINKILQVGGTEFTYTFDLPNHDIGLGNYLLRVSGDVGSAELIIPVVSDPDNYERPTAPLSITTDFTSYEIGDVVAISGHVLDPIDRSTGVVGPVTVRISEEGGEPLQITILNPHKRADEGTKADYSVSAIPQFTGMYETELVITKNIFDAGRYVLTAEHSGHTARSTFEVSDQLEQGKMVIGFDKAVYGLGQTATLGGVLPGSTTPNVGIVLTRPDGTTLTTASPVLEQRFEWKWDIPDAEKSFSTAVQGGGDIMTSNLGIYKATVTFDSVDMDLLFRVSLDPENDLPPTSGLTIAPDKDGYMAGDELSISGNVGTVRSDRVGTSEPVILRIYKISPHDQLLSSDVQVRQDGSFSGSFDLTTTVFEDGSYGISAEYAGHKTVSVFAVGAEPGSLSIRSDRQEYLPGSKVVITGTGGPDSGRLEIGTIGESDSETICGVTICGSTFGTRASMSFSSGSFEHTIHLPDSVSLGTHEVLVVYDSFVRATTFEIVDELPKAETVPRTVIEKENRITDRETTIVVAEKESDGATISPRVISGSMLANRGDEAAVNLAVYSPSGVCVIGQAEGCLVSESTRKPGQIHEVVEADGMSLNVRYSGPDVRLEKFSILPESSDAFLPDSEWRVEVAKDDQTSRLYYKVTYKTS